MKEILAEIKDKLLNDMRDEPLDDREDDELLDDSEDDELLDDSEDDEFVSWTGKRGWCNVNKYNLEPLPRHVKRGDKLFDRAYFVSVSD